MVLARIEIPEDVWGKDKDKPVVTWSKPKIAEALAVAPGHASVTKLIDYVEGMLKEEYTAFMQKVTSDREYYG